MSDFNHTCACIDRLWCLQRSVCKRVALPTSAAPDDRAERDDERSVHADQIPSITAAHGSCDARHADGAE